MQQNGHDVVQAHSQQSASALYHRLSVDLTKAPYLSWTWRVEGALGAVDEQLMASDDFPARVYVLLSSLPLRFSPRALCYVWSSNTPAGGHWISPYSNNVVIVNLRSGEHQAGQWLTEKRNVKEDIQRYFGDDISYAEGVAIMTDTDNLQSEVTSYYGDVYFSAD